MGIDIYGSFQARSGDRWTDVCRYDYGERGALLLWLAPWSNVRDIEHIADWRGLPTDLRRKGVSSDENFSWLMDDEILDALPLIERRTEILSEEECQRKTQKEYWDLTWINHPHRLITARSKPIQSNTELEMFEVEFFLDISEEVKEFTDLVLKLKNTYGEVRFVFRYE